MNEPNSPPSQPAAPLGNGPWPVLDIQERRLLGVMVEKAKTTPDAYPLSVNALVTGANQKSNRDPLLNLSDLDVEDALVRCQKKNLAIKITGGRVIRWRHNLYEAWHVDKVDLAVLAELLLRGPQTEGELRTPPAAWSRSTISTPCGRCCGRWCSVTSSSTSRRKTAVGRC